MTELAGLLAHELNQPLAQIAGAIELLGFELDPDEREEALSILRRAVAHAQQVVDRLRLLPGGEAGVIGSVEATDLVALTRDAVDDLNATVLAEHPTWIQAPERLPAHVDPVGIRQVLINLLTNAATYSPAGQTITVDLTREGHELRIAVRDGGTGVAPEDAERIFEAWQRADTDTRGLGLGLYLSRRIARAHGGDLRLEPADIEGSIFVLELPVEADA